MFLRRNLVCFYCGRRSSQKKTAGIREWQCNSCEAVNYLDENGNTTDPPVQDSILSSPRYAGRGEAVASPELGPLTESVFCNTCLKNQYLLSHNLAEYLPDPEDARYAEYERNLPKYRERLEARYPPVCADCEPRVRARLRTTGYAAKTDHLRRMTEITKENRQGVNISSTSAFFLAAAGLCWWLAHLTQIAWHAAELIKLLGTEEAGFPGSDRNDMIWTHIWMRLQYTSPPGITSNVVSLWSLLLTLCSFWWNPAMGRISWQRTVGLREYYKLQGILLLSRYLAWRFLGSATTQVIDVKVQTAAHGITCMFNIFVTVVVYRTVQIRQLPRIVFEAGEGLGQLGFPSEVARITSSSRKTLFPVEVLGPSQSGVAHFPSPPTPPSDDSEDDQTIVTTTVDSDAMDIDTPERQAVSWTPRKPLSSISNTSTPAPSPFRGHLPPAPISQAHRLRNPPNKPSFRKTSETRQKAFFDSMHKKPAGSEQHPGAKAFSSGAADIQFAPPQFFARKQEDTGLESMFSGLVSLDDVPNEVGSIPAADQKDPPPLESSILTTVWSISETVLVLFAVCDLTFSNTTSRAGFVRIATLIAILLDSILHLRDRLSPNRPVWLLSDLLLYAGELFAAVGLLSTGNIARYEISARNQSFYEGEIVFFWIFALRKVAGVGNRLFDRLRPTVATNVDNDTLTGNERSPAERKT